MPGLNRMGPAGAGPMSGRGMGLCRGGSARFATPQQMYGVGRGFGGRGRCFGGRGFRRMAYDPVYAAYPQADAESERDALAARADMLKTELDQIQNRITQLEKPREQT